MKPFSRGPVAPRSNASRSGISSENINMNSTTNEARGYNNSTMPMLHEYEVVHTPQFMSEAREQMHILNSRLLGSLDIKTSRRYEKSLAMPHPQSSATFEISHSKTRIRSLSDNFFSRVEDTTPGHVKFRDYIVEQPPRSRAESKARGTSMQNYGWKRDIERSCGSYDYYDGLPLISSPTPLARRVSAREFSTRRIGQRTENGWRPAGHGDPEWSEYRVKEDEEDHQSQRDGKENEEYISFD